MVVCASKSYLAQYGVPEKPADLTNHSWLEYSVRPDNEFELIAPEGISTKLLPEGRFVTNDPMTISRWLVAGAGIAYVPLMWVINEINSGVLEILFPRYQSDPRPVYALYTEKDKLPLKVQVCINYLTEYFVEVAELFQECGEDERNNSNSRTNRHEYSLDDSRIHSGISLPDYQE
jgi:DNA-binding transcriptional LysR family regulator